MKKRILFYCQSLLGIGHFIRSRELLFALRDFEVCFLYGGESIPGFDWPAWVEVVYLPALRSDTAFENLYVVDGEATLEEVKAQRKELLLATFDRFAPDALMIELFPFGRGKFKFELLPLLAHARATNPQIKIACSLRDILVTRAQQNRYQTDVVKTMNQYFDWLLVHADPRVQTLEESFGGVADLTCPLHYTGYVAQPSPEVTHHESVPLILVSIGGGRVGHELIECVFAASPLVATPHGIQVFTGPHIPADVFEQLRIQAALLPHVTLSRHTTEFPAWLRRASLSISMAGYNTCMDILAARADALVYPFHEHDNDEQTRRAHKLAQLGLVGVIEPAQLTPRYCANEITRRLRSVQVAPAQNIDLDGANRTAAILVQSLSAL
ncbi:MAG: glycosyl transferase [Acidobacteria bacterium]|nr:glycosyl transferase [Acidobacteriota bacterium]